MSERVKGAIIGAAVAWALGAAWGNYRWHQGFGAGADTMLCTGLGMQEGWKAAMQAPSYQHIKGKHPPYWPESLRPEGPPVNLSTVGAR